MPLYAVGGLMAHFEKQVETKRDRGNHGFPPPGLPCFEVYLH